MKLTVVLAILIGTLVLACSSVTPVPAEPTPNIDATVAAKVAQERAVDATVQAKVSGTLSAQEAKTPHTTQAACKLTGGETVQSGWTGKDTGDNSCNSCFCTDGVLGCTEMACPAHQVSSDSKPVPTRQPTPKPEPTATRVRPTWTSVPTYTPTPTPPLEPTVVSIPLELGNPTWFIPSVEATVEHLKFYETDNYNWCGPNTYDLSAGFICTDSLGLDWDERQYRYSFEQDSTHYIAWELYLTHPIVKKIGEGKYDVEWAYYKDGSRFDGGYDLSYVPIYSPTSRISQGLGEAKPGYFDPGSYTAQFYVDGVLVAQGTFVVY